MGKHTTSALKRYSQSGRLTLGRIVADFIKLDQFLKVTNVVQSGGEAKQLIRSGEVDVNGELELRRGRKLYDQDVVTVEDASFTVQFSAGSDASSAS